MEADSGLALTRQQAIVKNNDGQDHRNIYASLRSIDVE